MAQVSTATFELPRWRLWYAVPPVVVIGAASYLINHFGYPLDHLASATVQNGNAEAAGRLRVLATWLLLGGVGIACIVYCAWSAFGLAAATFRRLALVYVLLAAGGVLLVAGGKIEGGQRLMDRRVICAAFALVESPATYPPQEKAAPASYGQPAPPVVDDEFACGRSNLSYRRLWWLNQIQKFLLVLMVPALVLGTISCRALPAKASEEDCRYQVARLKTHLYLTATALVSGLLFLSALIHWPGFAFQGDVAAVYRAHVDAYILYWGVGYSLLIASCYVPVAIDLTRACEAVPGRRRAPAGKAGADGGESGGATPASELLGLVKTVAALFAPAIAGLLGGVLNL